jgi:hypothetical protein
MREANERIGVANEECENIMKETIMIKEYEEQKKECDE